MKCLILFFAMTTALPALAQMDEVAAFHDRAKADADRLKQQQSAKVKAYAAASRAKWKDVRRRIAEQYSKRPPLQDYERVDRPRVETMEEKVAELNRKLIDSREFAASEHRREFDAAEDQRLLKFTTEEELRARQHDERKVLYLQAEADYWNKLESMDVKVYADAAVYHSVKNCPIGLGSTETFSHTVKHDHAYCRLCKPPVADVDENLLPQRYPDPGEYVPGVYRPAVYSPIVPPQAALEIPHTFEFGSAEYLERIRCSRQYDVYFAVINADGVYQLAWYPWNKMDRNDQKYIGRMNLERKRERDAIEEKIKGGR